MDVTRTNFKELFPKIDQEIKNASYLSFDCEFSGIRKSYLSFFDTAEERYRKRLENEMMYDIVQFGLSIFKEKDKKVECSCYNFYIFKYHVTNSILPDHKMTISSSAFEFLAFNGFNFNKLFKNGITYANISEEHRLKACSIRKDKELLINGEMNFEHQKLMNDALSEYNEFLRDENKIVLELGPYQKSKLNLIKATIDSAEKNRCDSAETNLGTKSNGLNIGMEIYRENHTNLWKLKVRKQQTKDNFKFDYNQIADEAIGFSKVIQSIIHHKKPIVGHNVLLDIMHIINQFIAPLPSEFVDFRFITSQLFPLIFDTKLMSMALSNLNKLKVKSLGELYNYFKDNFPQFIDIELTNSKLEHLDHLEPCKSQFHQAGYDSFVTGVCFRAIKCMVESDGKKSIYNDSRFKNKFYNAWSYDIPYLSTEEKQNIRTDRSNLFHFEFDCDAFEFERKLTVFDGYKLDYLDDETCLVAILDPEMKSKFKLIESDKELRIKQYDEYKKQNETSRSKLQELDVLNGKRIGKNEDLNHQANQTKHFKKIDNYEAPSMKFVNSNEYSGENRKRSGSKNKDFCEVN